ncbi:MAG TPA: helix-turn-helix domain-containing protein [Solirubrobacteraceae bacterium]|nr:helix-turn-helix domain-containing protein [Solirubrobacteraceae bacterium]
MAILSRRSAAASTRQVNRSALIRATLELLAAPTPFADLTIEQIVRQAGLSRPTFYTYFQDKRALVLELGAIVHDAVAEAADPWLSSGQGDVRSTLSAVLDAFREHRHALAAVVEAAAYDDAVSDFWHAFHDRFRVAAEARVRAGDPELTSERVDARAYTLVWMTERTMTAHLAQPRVDEAALLDELALAWTNASGARGSD